MGYIRSNEDYYDKIRSDGGHVPTIKELKEHIDYKHTPDSIREECKREIRIIEKMKKH